MIMKFNSQKEAVNYYGHSWSYIQRHYLVTRCYNSVGTLSYFILK